MKSPKEIDLVKACLHYLQLCGFYCWRANSGAVKVGNRFIRFASINGISDILGCLPDGKLLAVECKMPKGRLRNEQKTFLAAVHARGGVALIVRDVTELHKHLARFYVVP
mgnify:CR=1 FL=1